MLRINNQLTLFLSGQGTFRLISILSYKLLNPLILEIEQSKLRRQVEHSLYRQNKHKNHQLKSLVKIINICVKNYTMLKFSGKG